MPAIAANHRAAAPRYLEDFAVGDRTETGEMTITREMIRSFAELYDPQPMHLGATLVTQSWSLVVPSRASSGGERATDV